MDDLYNLLGVAPGASPEQIKSAFRAQAKRVHPDAHPHLSPRQRDEHNRRFIALAQAYETLSDPERRRDYDRRRAAAGARAASGGTQGTGAFSRGAHAPSGSAAPGQSSYGQTGHSQARPGQPSPPTPEQAMNDLAAEVERVLSQFGLDLRQPVEVILGTLLDWARSLYRQVGEALGAMGESEPAARARPDNSGSQRAGRPGADSDRGQPAAASPPQESASTAQRARPHRPATARRPSHAKEERALDEELATLKRRVRSDIAQGRPTGRPPTLEEQLAALKQRMGKG